MDDGSVMCLALKAFSYECAWSTALGLGCEGVTGDKDVSICTTYVLNTAVFAVFASGATAGAMH